MLNFSPLAGSGTARSESHAVVSRSAVGNSLCRPWILALLFSCLCVPFSTAQVSASLSGLITDPSGATVSAASVTTKNLDTGISRTVPTDQHGRYRFFALAIGPYEIRVTKDGFAEGIRSGIRLVVGQDATVDLGLRVGQVSEQAKVTGDAPVVNLTTQDISGLVGERQVKDLPLNGRSYDLLLTLNPGVVNFTWEKTGGIGVSNSTTGKLCGFRESPTTKHILVKWRGSYGGCREQHATGWKQPRVVRGGCGAGIQCTARFLWCRIWQAPRRPSDDRDPIGDQSAPRKRIRVPPQQCSGRAEFL
jgi:hypothetical protein